MTLARTASPNAREGVRSNATAITKKLPMMSPGKAKSLKRRMTSLVSPPLSTCTWSNTTENMARPRNRSRPS